MSRRRGGFAPEEDEDEDEMEQEEEEEEEEEAAAPTKRPVRRRVEEEDDEEEEAFKPRTNVRPITSSLKAPGESDGFSGGATFSQDHTSSSSLAAPVSGATATTAVGGPPEAGRGVPEHRPDAARLKASMESDHMRAEEAYQRSEIARQVQSRVNDETDKLSWNLTKNVLTSHLPHLPVFRKDGPRVYADQRKYPQPRELAENLRRDTVTMSELTKVRFDFPGASQRASTRLSRKPLKTATGNALTRKKPVRSLAPPLEEEEDERAFQAEEASALQRHRRRTSASQRGIVQLTANPLGDGVEINPASLVEVQTAAQTQMEEDAFEAEELEAERRAGKRRRKERGSAPYSRPWTAEETKLFYRGLRQIGTDFASLAEWMNQDKAQEEEKRTRTEVSDKFKREAASSRGRLITLALREQAREAIALLDEREGPTSLQRLGLAPLESSNGEMV